jgi:hypothetical protein
VLGRWSSSNGRRDTFSTVDGTGYMIRGTSDVVSGRKAVYMRDELTVQTRGNVSKNLPGPAAVIPAVLRSRAKYKVLYRTSGPYRDRYRIHPGAASSSSSSSPRLTKGW